MAKKTPTSRKDASAILDEVTELEELVKRRKKAQKELRALETEDDGGEDDLEPSLPGSELVDKVLASLGGEGSFSVTKLTAEGETLECGNYDLPLWPDAMQGVIKKNGGGNYVLVFHDENGRIAKRIKRTYPGPVAAPVQTGGSSDMLALLKLQEDRDARRDSQMEALRLEAMKGQQAMMTAMMTMMGSQNKPLINNASELATIAALFKGKEKGTDLGELRDLMDLLEDLKGDSRGDEAPTIQTDNPIVALLAPIAAALTKGLNAVPAKMAPTPRPAPAAIAPTPVPAPVPVPTPSPAPTTANSSPAAEESGLLQHAPMLKAAIDAGATPELSATKAWEDAISKDQEDDLIALIEKGDWKTLGEHPDLKAHSVWIESFRAELRARIPAEEPEPAKEAPPVS